MRRIHTILAVAVGYLFVGAGAATAAEPNLKVVVTIKPLHALVAQVMAGIGTPELLVTGTASPHTYALKPSNARSLNQASLFFRMAEAVEPFTVKITRSLPKSVEVVTLQEAPGLTLWPRRTGITFGRHAHAGEHDDPHGAMDGHFWLEPANAGVMVDRIAGALSAKAPSHAAAFRANADALKARLAALGEELGHTLKPVADAPYIVFHDATQYLERRYGLNVIGSISIDPEIPTGARRLMQLREKIVALGAVCVFAEPQFDTRLIANLIEGTRARTGTLDPEGSRLEAGPDLYFALMRRLADDLKSCLAAGAQPVRG